MGGGKKPKVEQGNFENILSGMAQQYYGQTQPLRTQMLQQYGDVMSGNYDYQNSPTYAPLFSIAKQGIDKAYVPARENILSNTAPGGGQTAALGALERDRARQMGMVSPTIVSDLSGDLMNKGYGAAFLSPQQSMSGMGSAAASYAGRFGAVAGQQGASKMAGGQALGGLGQGLGSYMGSK